MARNGRLSGVAALLFAVGIALGFTGCVTRSSMYNSSMMPDPVVDENAGTSGYSAPTGGGCASCGSGGCTTCGAAGLGSRLGLGQHLGQHRPHCAGYQEGNPGLADQYGQGCPRELTMTSLPPHKVAPPDILMINLVRMVPRPPYRIEPLEALLINVTDTLPSQPIAGPFSVSLEGTINLGYSYGSVYVGGLTPEQAQLAIRRHLANTLKNPQVNVALAQFRGMEQIRGEHLVRPDGTISLGSYGAVYVAGLSLGQAKCVIEKHLSEYFLNPQVSIDVFAYNSRVYYVIIDGAGFGQQVFRLPATGNETVLDAVSFVQGIAPMSSKRRIVLARPSPVHLGCNQILPIDWRAITEGGSTATNYQVFPGDRVYVGPDRLIMTDNYLSKLLAPIERVFGATLLGASTIQTVQGSNTSGVFIR